ncbi:hypothetical protein BaRGS_00028762 [Batillaria attramentaria]|uniref:Nucleolar protein 6 n=1 Tax=Batillaria attramentaria TaxID=370345 RepID=A0ABD0JZ95_9CAEN
MGVQLDEMEGKGPVKRPTEKETDSQDDERKPKRKRTSGVEEEDVPTAQEMLQLRETENLYNTNLFRMQITELLTEVRIKKKRYERLKEEVEKLKDVLLNMSEGKERELHHQKWLHSQGVRLPVLQEPKTTKGCFQFRAPTRVFLSGSVTLSTCVHPSKAADLVMEMPKECFQGKDCLNHRYVRKRALYLATVAARLMKAGVVADSKFTYHAGNPFKPMLVTKIGVGGKPFTVHLHAVPEEGVFKPSRFHITKNNVRPRWFSGTDREDGDTGADDAGGLPPTPMYNTSVLQDICFSASADFLSQQLDGASSLQDGISLLKVWLHQRQLDVGYGSFSSFLAAMFVCHLVSQRLVNKMMSSYQVLRHALLHLSTSDWLAEPVTMCAQTGEGGRPTLDGFQQEFEVVFVDVTGYVNLCLGMTKAMYKRVCHEASIAVECMTGQVSHNFHHLLMTPVPFFHKFDHIFHVTSNSDILTAVVEKCQLAERLLDHGGHYVATVTPSLLDLLSQGLGDRVELIQLQLPVPSVWSVSEDPPPGVSEGTLTFGVLLHETNALRLLDRGPPANSQEAVDFRQFWGEKSELRRFKDGGIAEAVVWALSTCLSQKRSICSKVVSHVLHRHADIHPDHIQHVERQIENVLHVPRRIITETTGESSKTKGAVDAPHGTSMGYGTGEERHYHVRQVLEDLGRSVRTLPNLPLTINTVTGTDPVFRFTEVFPPHSAVARLTSKSLLQSPDAPLPLYTPALTVVCKLEGSGKWPEDLEAVRRLKAAYYAKLGEDLANLHSLTVSVSPTRVDVLKDGFVFRLKLGLTREIGLLRMVRSPEGMVKMEDTPQALKLEAEITTLPRITSWLQGVQQEHQAFCATARLVKRWTAAQLLLGHVPDLTVDKMVAHLFENPLPFTPPVSPQVGLLRFLKLVSSENFKVEDYTEKTWPTPQPVILNRLRSVARESLRVLEEQISKPSVDWKTIFRPPLEGFDLVVHLAKRWLPRRYQAIDAADISSMMAAYPNKEQSSVGKQPRRKLPVEVEMPVTELDPVQYFLQELQEAYGELCLIFHDVYGGDAVAVLWKPGALNNQEFKATNVKACKPVVSESSDVALRLNLEAIVEDIKIIGKNLVARVEAHDLANSQCS